MARDPDLLVHRTWLGYVQKVGLVVSAPALVAAQSYPDAGAVIAKQRALLALDLTRRWDDDEAAVLPSLPAFLQSVLGWDPAIDLAGSPGGPELPAALDVALPEHGEVLSPSYAVPDPDAPSSWLMLVREEPAGTDLDRPLDFPPGDRRWNGSPEARFERLLRDNEIPIGLLFNGTSLRLVNAPRGESSGHLTFAFKAMCEVGGRPLLAGLVMLLDAQSVFQGKKQQRLPTILRESRRYQSEVSTALAEQLLGALGELVRGFQAADEASGGRLLADVLRADRARVYGGLLTTLMRLVFILYAEDRGLLPASPVYVSGYSVTGLFERLRADDGRIHDAMGQRYGAWAQLLTLFRVLHDGASHGGLRVPARSGRLFDPDAYPFLEGRPHDTLRSENERLEPPKIADGVIFRVLDKLLYLDGERLSYRALDVEDIGSVYEGMMGYALEVAVGPSLAVRPHHVVVDLGELLGKKPDERVKTLADVKCKLPKAQADAVKKARVVPELVVALAKQTSPRMPDVLPAGALYLQPSEERRRSGSHYTPRSLTEPIVRTTLDPILAALVSSAPPSPPPVSSPPRKLRASRPPAAAPGPRPEQLLGLKVADPAMGSGAFLVEVCRYLADALVRAWQEYGGMPETPPDEDPLLHARRLVAQRCLYGVDKNPFAVDLAKLSLWLFTLAKDHPFTFIDHALRHGDSLVGLSREQIASFTWDLSQAQVSTFRPVVMKAIEKAEGLRAALHAMGDSDDTREKQRLLREADVALVDVRLLGDLVVAAFFEGDNDKVRKRGLVKYADKARLVLDKTGDREELEAVLAELRRGERGVPAFHWAVEFPEVFSRGAAGFDAFVGNPPFMAGRSISGAFSKAYLSYLGVSTEAAGGQADLVAYFFRHSFDRTRWGGKLGMIATNTIAQGDTRASGLHWICTHDGVVFNATRRFKWPGGAAVTVSVVHMAKGSVAPPCCLDGRSVDRITAFLFDRGGHDDPVRMYANEGKSFKGSMIYGPGFTFDDKHPEATPIGEMRRLIARDPTNGNRIFPYLGGEEMLEEPAHRHRRYVIGFGGMDEAEARGWPDLMAIVEAKVRPERERLSDNPDGRRRKRCWWQWGRDTPALARAAANLPRLLMHAYPSTFLAFAFVPTSTVVGAPHCVFALPGYSSFAVLQSRPHECWARTFASSQEDRFRYTPSDCFETFPFPAPFDPTKDPVIEAHRAALEVAGKAYYDYRAALMVRNNQGLTTTYNRFHDPEENDLEIQELRTLHTAMDKAVLSAYGWTDIPTDCKFLLDYEEEADDDEEAGGKRRKKKPWRYRWPDEVRDEVLARLIDLNQQRAAEERRLGVAPRQAKKRDEDEEEAGDA
jgi:hypothetical protein